MNNPELDEYGRPSLDIPEQDIVRLGQAIVGPSEQERARIEQEKADAAAAAEAQQAYQAEPHDG